VGLSLKTCELQSGWSPVGRAGISPKLSQGHLLRAMNSFGLLNDREHFEELKYGIVVALLLSTFHDSFKN